jgi:hypothetical protein
MAQVIECLSSKHESLISKPQHYKREKERKKRKEKKENYTLFLKTQDRT